MSILDSSIAPIIFLLAGLGVLAGFFRKTLLKFLIFFAIEIVFLALFPKLLLGFVHLVSRLSSLIR
jgi:hypothetical protein